MRLQYQFTFKEYLEASRISTKLVPFSKFELWTRAVVIAAGGIAYILVGLNPLWGYFIIGFSICYIPLVKFVERRNIMSRDLGLFWPVIFLQIRLWFKPGIPASYFFPWFLMWTIGQLLYWIFEFFGIFHLRSWIQKTNIWHDLVTLQVTESGLELETAKVSLKLKWQFYSHFSETENLFIIYFSDSQHFFPKRAFKPEQHQALREFLCSKIVPVLNS
ncbi:MULTISPECIES: YcxB family protein [unclassified Microcoleus]|uniref:YcxB family protein n=1 Tax=unclassified Microcoleus TaxID=2642155 RepID=UPI002FD40FBE